MDNELTDALTDGQMDGLCDISTSAVGMLYDPNKTVGEYGKTD
jgi:hypothetical protein